MSIFPKYKYLLSLKLEIVLAIPTSDDWKIETNHSAAQGLRW